MSRYLTTVLLAAGLVWSCGGGGAPATPVPVSGARPDLNALEGEWSGDYSSEESGRSGTIVFKLKGGTTSATGDVTMNAKTAQPDSASTAQPIAIRFVSIEGGRVQGKLDPYIEPTCKCQLTTVFDGRLDGSTLAGTYVTVLPNGQVQSGRWSVTRRR
jgi:hypothetical protein